MAANVPRRLCSRAAVTGPAAWATRPQRRKTRTPGASAFSKESGLAAGGRGMAEAMGRGPRIMERWLTDGLGLDWVTADEEAARLEHAVSDVVEKRLYEVLGRPATCPHGNPIPGYSKALPREVRLASLQSGSHASVSRVSEGAEREAPTLLTYLHERGRPPGRDLALIEADSVARTSR